MGCAIAHIAVFSPYLLKLKIIFNPSLLPGTSTTGKETTHMKIGRVTSKMHLAGAR